MKKEVCLSFVIDLRKGIEVCAHKWDVRYGHVLKTHVPDIHSTTLVSTMHPFVIILRGFE